MDVYAITMDSPHLDSGDLVLCRSGFSFAITNVLEVRDLKQDRPHRSDDANYHCPHLICLESPSPRNFGFEYLHTLKSLLQSVSEPPECLLFFLPSKIPQTRSISGVYGPSMSCGISVWTLTLTFFVTGTECQQWRYRFKCPQRDRL